MRSFSRFGLGAVTAATMASATFPIIVVSVLAAQLIDEFEISRAEVGFLVTATGLVGAMVSPLFGRITDRLGSVKSVTGTLIAGGFTLTALALAPSYGFLLGAAVLTGFPNGWGNPSTNALIVDNVPAGTRGVITGIKQSGVQIGTFLGGLLLPVLAGWWSWRVAVLVFLAMPVAGLIGMIGRRESEHRETRDPSSTGALPTSVRWVAIYGFISGLASSAIIAFVPLFANEELGWSEAAAGTMIALMGLTGIIARVLWPRLSERTLGHGRTLRILALLSVLSATLLALSSIQVVGGWVLPVAVLLLGSGAVAWNAVGMLAVMDFSPSGLVGKGTGVVLFGFLFGLAIGPPLMGFSVDSLGTYTPGWVTTGVLMALSAFIAVRVPAGITLVER
ncbi:MAG: MFS transporter [Acidimicrobiia bacterium]|jgi:MFS family permease